MLYYNNKYKSYGLGYKPIYVLKKQLERTLIKDIHYMQREIKNLAAKRLDYLEYKKKILQYENRESMYINPLKDMRLRLISDCNNYKKGVRYWFKPKELKDDVKTKVSNIDSLIKKMYEDLKSMYFTKNFSDHSVMLKSKDVDYKIEYEIDRRINHYKNAIIIYQNELKIKQEKNAGLENIKGIAAQALNKTRQRAIQVKSKIISNEYCPYCGEEIMNFHVDHIYPVAKGGLSTTQNMVRVCAACNLKKRDLTLNQFINKYGLDRDFVEENLERLNKAY